MYWGNVIMVMFLVVYTVKFINLRKKDYIVERNQEMEKLRFKQYKTLEEQKKFLDLKYPKKIKQKMTINSVLHTLGFLMFLCLLFFAYGTLFVMLGIIVPVWLAILFIMIVPLIITMFLNKFGLSDNNTLFDLFRRRKK
jgi:hypothetical protein